MGSNLTESEVRVRAGDLVWLLMGLSFVFVSDNQTVTTMYLNVGMEQAPNLSKSWSPGTD